MGYLGLLGTIVKRKLEGTDKTAPPVKTVTPLGLHQGSIFELPEVDLALAQADGSIINIPMGNQVVAAVGKYTLFDMTVFNCYFGDGKTYVQLVTKDGINVLEARLWSSNKEVLPASNEEWEFWLGSYKKDNAGEIERDESGKGIKAEGGLIGWPNFGMENNTIVFDRMWSPSSESIEPFDYVESIVDSTGKITTVNHEACEYYRKLTNKNDSVIEFLYASVIQTDDSGSVNVFIGIALDKDNLKILRA